MTTLRTVTLASLRILATVFALSWIAGLLVTVVGMIEVFNAVTAANQEATAAKTLSICMIATSCGFLLFPVGVFLHWMIAKRTGVFPSVARQSLFWGSLFMCIAFPVGTIMGGVTLWLLTTSEAFRNEKRTEPFSTAGWR
jgi:hypothetical protein